MDSLIPRSSANIDQLCAAIIEARVKIGIIPKNKIVKVGSYSYSYADLTQTIEYIIKNAAEYGLSIDQGQAAYGEMIFIVTTLMHKQSGQWKEYYWHIPKLHVESYAIVDKEGKQLKSSDVITHYDAYMKKFNGSSTTARRYALQAVFCTASEDEDTDGNDSKEIENKKISEKQAALIGMELKNDPTKRTTLENKYGSLADIPASACNGILQWINPEKYKKSE